MGPQWLLQLATVNRGSVIVAACAMRGNARQLVTPDTSQALAPCIVAMNEGHECLNSKVLDIPGVIQRANQEVVNIDKEINKLLEVIENLNKRRTRYMDRLLEAKRLYAIRKAELYEERRVEADRILRDEGFRNRILSRDGNQCRHCKSTQDLSIDHIVPIWSGGTNRESNLQVLCRPCNSRKGTRVEYSEPEFVVGTV